MLGTQPLTPDQQQAIERVARERGVRCIHCGSPILRCDDRVVLTHNHVKVMLLCDDPDAAHPTPRAAIDKSYPFEYEDAARFGIERPPDPPPWRHPGETFPR